VCSSDLLPRNAPKFRIIGLDSDWDAYDLMFGSIFAKADDLIKAGSRDNFMANVLKTEVLQKGQKAVVQIGYNHSFTRYRLAAIKDGKFVCEAPGRFGYLLYHEFGKRVFQVSLHNWHLGAGFEEGGVASGDENIPMRLPMGGLIEDLLKKMGNRPLGFDVEASPLANLRDHKSYFFAFQPKVVFADIAQGYIFLKPLDEQSHVTWARGFVDKNNYEKVKAIAEKRGWVKQGKCPKPEILDAKLAEYFKRK